MFYVELPFLIKSFDETESILNAFLKVGSTTVGQDCVK